MFSAAEIMAVGWALAATSVVSRWFGTPSAWLDIAAAAAIIGSVAAYHRLRTALVAVETTSEAWRGERDVAMVQVARLIAEIEAGEKARSALAAEVAALKMRPDLSTLERAVKQGNDDQAVSNERMHGVMVAIAAALIPGKE